MANEEAMPTQRRKARAIIKRGTAVDSIRAVHALSLRVKGEPDRIPEFLISAGGLDSLWMQFEAEDNVVLDCLIKLGAVDDYAADLIPENGTKPLSWAIRGKITMGTARGLQFLHTAETPLIHGDIKSANILLDGNFEPRIGDFGLARTSPQNHSDKKSGFDVSRVCGTRPYLPDDFCANKKLSPKVDTYSFGVVMFEIATGLRAFNEVEGPRFLKNLVNKYDQHSLSELADKFAGKQSFHVFEALIRLGKLCVADKAELRPEMVQVYNDLQNVMSSNSCVLADTENNTKINKPSMQFQDTSLPVDTKDVDSIKLKGRKAALLAPLHEIPSISMLYTNVVRESDPRKNITTDDQCNRQNMMDKDFVTTDF